MLGNSVPVIGRYCSPSVPTIDLEYSTTSRDRYLNPKLVDMIMVSVDNETPLFKDTPVLRNFS